MDPPTTRGPTREQGTGRWVFLAFVTLQECAPDLWGSCRCLGFRNSSTCDSAAGLWFWKSSQHFRRSFVTTMFCSQNRHLESELRPEAICEGSASKSFSGKVQNNICIHRSHGQNSLYGAQRPFNENPVASLYSILIRAFDEGHVCMQSYGHVRSSADCTESNAAQNM